VAAGRDALFQVCFAGIRALARLIGPVSSWIWRTRAAMARASQVEEQWAFVRSDLKASGEPAVYHLRSSGTALCIRHGTGDQHIFDEVFRRHVYDFPAPVARALEAAGPRLQVVDLGGHVGYFGAHIRSRYPEARITAFEPDPESAGLLERAIAENDAGDSWSVIRACALNRDDVVDFAPGQNCLSRLEASSDRGTIRVPAVDVLPKLAGADFVKLDIEGSEWPILEDPRFAALDVRAAVLEYHPHMAPEPDARAAAARLLESAGFETAPIFHAPEGHGMMWAWRRATG
jgi:FkbM family methyltransferase